MSDGGELCTIPQDRIRIVSSPCEFGHARTLDLGTAEVNGVKGILADNGRRAFAEVDVWHDARFVQLSTGGDVRW